MRPNSPIHTISVVSSRPRSFRSSISVAQAGSSDLAEALDRRRSCSACVSQPAERDLERDLDERHAALDQPAGQQAALAEQVAAVGVAQRAGFSSSRSNALAASGFISRTARS